MTTKIDAPFLIDSHQSPNLPTPYSYDKFGNPLYSLDDLLKQFNMSLKELHQLLEKIIKEN